MSRKKPSASLSPLEHEVMKIVWDLGSATAEEIRGKMSAARPLKESTVRTLLRRMEEKGYLAHSRRKRAYVYEPTVGPDRAAMGELRRLIDRFCEGSVEALLVSMVNDEVVSRRELRRLSSKLDDEDSEEIS